MAIRRKRFQPWPFYRRTYFDAEMQAEVEELWRKMEEGYDPREYPGSPLYRGNVRSYSSTLARPNYGSTRYGLRETPDYLRGRDGMVEKGCNPEDLDFIVAKLLRGERLARGYRPHKPAVQGGGSGSAASTAATAMDAGVPVRRRRAGPSRPVREQLQRIRHRLTHAGIWPVTVLDTSAAAS